MTSRKQGRPTHDTESKRSEYTPTVLPATKRGKQLLDKATAEGWATWINSIADEYAVLDGCYFELTKAEFVRDFFRLFLRHSKGQWANQPFELLDWQWSSVIAPLFGWRRANGTRRYRKAYIEIPKKNGKSTLCSALALYLLVADGEAGAEVYLCASDRDQASIVYNESMNMVKSSGELSEVLQVRRSVKRIVCEATRSVLEAISSDADSAEGKNASALILDELHIWRGRDFYESIEYSGRARSQPLMIMITTAGDDLTTVCYEEHERALRILDGSEVASEYFAFISAAPDPEKWRDIEQWKVANPSFGHTINAETVAEDIRAAENNPRKQAALKRYGLNLWVGASDAWLSMDVWAAAQRDYAFEDFANMKAWGGIDLARTQDLASVVWLVDVDGSWRLWPRIYLPGDLIEAKEKEDKVPYRFWRDQGLLIATDGDEIDYAKIRADVIRDSSTLQVVEIGFDPHNASQLCNQQLGEIDGLPMVAVKQSWELMGPPSVEFERRLKNQTINHPGNLVMNWGAAGCVAKESPMGNSVMPIKKKSRSRIDVIVASIMACGRRMATPSPVSGSLFIS